MLCLRSSSFSFSAVSLETVGTVLSDSHLSSQLAYTGVRCGCQMLPPSSPEGLSTGILSPGTIQDFWV